MPKFFAFILALISTAALAEDISLKVDVSRHLDNLSNVQLGLTYESRSTGLGCQTYSGDIMDPMRPVYIEKSVALREGKASETVPSFISRCNAVLISIDLKLRLDRRAVAAQNNTSRSEVDKNRLDFYFRLYYPATPEAVVSPVLRMSKRYVAGSDELKLTYSSSMELAPVIDGEINLSL